MQTVNDTCCWHAEGPLVLAFAGQSEQRRANRAARRCVLLFAVEHTAWSTFPHNVVALHISCCRHEAVRCGPTASTSAQTGCSTIIAGRCSWTSRSAMPIWMQASSVRRWGSARPWRCWRWCLQTLRPHPSKPAPWSRSTRQIAGRSGSRCSRAAPSWSARWRLPLALACRCQLACHAKLRNGCPSWRCCFLFAGPSWLHFDSGLCVVSGCHNPLAVPCTLYAASLLRAISCTRNMAAGVACGPVGDGGAEQARGPQRAHRGVPWRQPHPQRDHARRARYRRHDVRDARQRHAGAPLQNLSCFFLFSSTACLRPEELVVDAEQHTCIQCLPQAAATR